MGRKQNERKNTESLPGEKRIKKGDELLAEVGKFNRGGWKMIIQEIGVGGNSRAMQRGKYSCKRVGKKIKISFTPIFHPKTGDKRFI